MAMVSVVGGPRVDTAPIGSNPGPSNYTKVTGITPGNYENMIANELDKAIWNIPSGLAMLEKRENLINEIRGGSTVDVPKNEDTPEEKPTDNQEGPNVDVDAPEIVPEPGSPDINLK